ncbi:hypothetical protein COO91_02842 [Nostoc flagelliforme CCNUN1]|uniref:Uncharacterized protein n=1 Tax=Nostoc flagelliforme CCNUN1 TaxID=2038116 RepID=A0A2K8SNM7_9NOSO|nr:hypothetical protein COO91_02842 [Nostoc flagelliforme CCNUN1]
MVGEFWTGDFIFLLGMGHGGDEGAGGKFLTPNSRNLNIT